VNALLTYVRDTLGKAERPKDAPPAGYTPQGSPTTSGSPKASESKGR